jgi:hypothetical protein
MSDCRHADNRKVAAGRAGDDVATLLRTLDQDNVRHLSVTLLIDLLTLEADRSRAAELVCDAAVLAEDLLLAGDYEGAREVIRALARHAASPRKAAAPAARLALDGLVATVAFSEAADSAGDADRRVQKLFSELSGRIGPSCLAAVSRVRVPSALRARRAS